MAHIEESTGQHKITLRVPAVLFDALKERKEQRAQQTGEFVSMQRILNSTLAESLLGLKL